MDKIYEEFASWWSAPEQEELRKSCAQGWGWKIWKASRAALVVKLPPKRSDANRQGNFVPAACEAYDEAIDDCADALREAGISVKGDV
ncbi:hypothetical protein [Pantoea sp. BAV 3049]|uniref:hypothetical protein n=1 Tax=Pantoea sp. BAV 3049 TaxID=2654188 RepID=UPI00131BCA92|nr:hypothetical protein [Pantoea sp. BAV 3049]